jgi:hypothetical protein
MNLLCMRADFTDGASITLPVYGGDAHVSELGRVT